MITLLKLLKYNCILTLFICLRTALYAVPLFIFSIHPVPEKLKILGKTKLRVWYDEWYAVYREFVIEFHRGSRCYAGIAQCQINESYRPTETTRQYMEERMQTIETHKLLLERGIHPLSPEGRKYLR